MYQSVDVSLDGIVKFVPREANLDNKMDKNIQLVRETAFEWVTWLQARQKNTLNVKYMSLVLITFAKPEVV